MSGKLVFMSAVSVLVSALMLLPAPSAIASVTECTGTITGGVFDAVIVPEGASCVLSDAFIRGGVTILEDATIQAFRNHVDGLVDATGADGVRLVDNAIAHGVRIRGGGPAPSGFPNAPEYLICGNMIRRGDILIQGVTGGIGVRFFASAATVERCTGPNSLDRGHIVVTDNDNTRVLRVHHNTVRQGHVRVTENRITGPVSFVDNNVVPEGHIAFIGNSLTGMRSHVESNSAGRHLFVTGNTGPAVKHVRHNVVARHLVCEENQVPFIGGPNTAAHAVGQCG